MYYIASLKVLPLPHDNTYYTKNFKNAFLRYGDFENVFSGKGHLDQYDPFPTTASIDSPSNLSNSRMLYSL